MDKTDRKKRWEAEAGLRRFEPVSDNEVLTAVERAERHREPQNRDEHGVPWWVIVEHLGFVGSGWTTRQLRPQVEGLVFGGLLETSRRHSRTYWALTSAARERLAAWRQGGEVIELHESPQHRTWRMARSYSAENIDRLRAEVSSDLDRAGALLARGRSTRSDAFFDLKEHLSRRLWRLGSVTHCLYEWPEPDDATADVDDREDPGDGRLSPDAQGRLRWLRNGRRNPATWGWRDDEEDLLASEPTPVLVTVPADLVRDLRIGLHNELTVPAEGVLEVISRADREIRPEQYREHLEYLDELCVLLDVVGWAIPKQQAAVALDLRRHQQAVISALDFAVRSSVDELEDAEKGVPSKRDATAKRVAALHEFATATNELAAAIEQQEPTKEDQR
ncbi:MAG: hypothetical protein ACLP1Q_07310 [Solirubrobacteraceae bacterium]